MEKAPNLPKLQKSCTYLFWNVIRISWVRTPGPNRCGMGEWVLCVCGWKRERKYNFRHCCCWIYICYRTISSAIAATNGALLMCYSLHTDASFTIRRITICYVLSRPTPLLSPIIPLLPNAVKSVFLYSPPCLRWGVWMNGCAKVH